MSLLLTIFQNSEQLEHTEYIMLGVTVVLFALTVVNSVIISQQPQDETISSFKIPLISFLPFVSVFINLYLMMALSLHTWIRFGVWFLLGNSANVQTSFSLIINHSQYSRYNSILLVRSAKQSREAACSQTKRHKPQLSCVSPLRRKFCVFSSKFRIKITRRSKSTPSLSITQSMFIEFILR